MRRGKSLEGSTDQNPETPLFAPEESPGIMPLSGVWTGPTGVPGGPNLASCYSCDTGLISTSAVTQY